MVRRSSASGASVLRARPAPKQRHNPVNFHGNRYTPWFKSPHIRCSTLVAACPTRAHGCAQLPERRTRTSARQDQELRHHVCTQLIPMARRECHNSSVVFRRLRISTGYSQAITAGLSGGCKGYIHANFTPIPLQTHGNRQIGLHITKRVCASRPDRRGDALARRER